MTAQKALLEGFEEDIFINYNHDDNQSQIDLRGWVDVMHESLEIRLKLIVGEQPKIWRDNLMTGHQMLHDTIVVRLSKTAFLVSVLSPSYVNSEWCKLELNEFYARASERGGIKLNDRSRIFKVVKTPIGNNDPRIDPLEGTNLPVELRSLLQESLGYNFFELDDKGRPLEFWPELSKESRQKFLARLEDLAQDIKDFVFKCQQSNTPLAPNEISAADVVATACSEELNRAPGRRNIVYLAETTPELVDDRNEVKRMLQQHNYQVLPDENLPLEAGQAFEEKVQGYLSQSALSIHLIGADHTRIAAAEPEVQTALDLQHQLAARRVRKQHALAMTRAENDAEYSRLIWMPVGLASQEPKYQEFIDYLQNDPAAHENAEILCGAKLEDLKTTVQKRLQFSREERELKGNGKRIYLICDKQDKEAVRPLQDYLQQSDYEVLLPFTDDGQALSKHRENLRQCDGVLVFYGSVNTMSYKLIELRKVDALRDSKPLLAKGIYVAGPETEQKKAFATDEVMVIKNFGAFSPELIRPFLKEFEVGDRVTAGA